MYEVAHEDDEIRALRAIHPFDVDVDPVEPTRRDNTRERGPSIVPVAAGWWTRWLMIFGRVAEIVKSTRSFAACAALTRFSYPVDA